MSDTGAPPPDQPDAVAGPVDTGSWGPELETVWAKAVDGLREDALSPQHRAWVGLTRPLGLVEDTALLAAPNEFASPGAPPTRSRSRPHCWRAGSLAGRRCRW